MLLQLQLRSTVSRYRIYVVVSSAKEVINIWRLSVMSVCLSVSSFTDIRKNCTKGVSLDKGKEN